ncbi:ABC transporter permease [Nocardioides sp. SOB77]|uniref:ABC transporter permease n=1 Tax=Nocardioides oceani TaxID=3058369 RepID=A0ABT8FBU1_9ACTN|nr:ABC transporter permease [Nocardioides oceani]MDN4172158.1 ABC transporter permease [Nocardioides oceani]
MTLFLTFTVLGLVLGAVYAIAASGLVLTYNTSGIFNFAHGAQAMIGAFLYYQLQVVWGVPALLSVLVLLLVVGPLMGFLLHRFIMGGLRDTADVTKIVVTVAILLGFVSLSHWAWDPQEARMTKMFFGVDSYVTVGGVVVRYHEIICLLAAAAIAIGLRLLFTRSRVGVLMRATVDDPDLLRLNGHDPERIAATAWALGSTLAVLAGILITPVAGGALEANALTLLVIDAFAAALFGRLRSIPRTFVGAIVLGLASTYLVAYAPSEWSWVTNLRDALPMIILFIVLLVLPQDRLRGAAVRTRERYEVPTVRRAAVWAGVMVLATVAFRQLIDDSSVGTLVLGLSFAIMALSLTLLTGYAGELNLAPVSFGAIATIVAFHSGIEGEGLDARMNVVGLALGVLAAALTGALVALPALRLRGLYLALATLAFGGLVSSMVLRETQERSWFGQDLALFPNGNLIVSPLAVGPLDLGDQTTFLYTASAVFAVLGVGVVALRNSGYGRRLAAMKDSPAAAAMLGQRLPLLKLSVFMISTGMAGLGGVFMSMALSSVTADHFVYTLSLSLVMLTVVGGIGYVSGALVGGLLAGGGFALIVGSFNELSIEHPVHAETFGVLSHLFLVLTALIGIGVGDNPSGNMHAIFRGQRVLARAPEVRYAALALTTVLYALAYTEVIGTWTFSLLVLVLWLALPAIGTALRAEKILPPEAVAARRATPLELVGIDTPYPPLLAEHLDRELGLPARHRATVPAPPVADATARTTTGPVAGEEAQHVPV